MPKKAPRPESVWTLNSVMAAIKSINAHLVGEEGVGDLSDVRFRDLRRALETLHKPRGAGKTWVPIASEPLP